MYKDVPHVDMEMHLPEQGTKVRMRWIDKAQIASPIVMGIPTLVAKLLFASLVSPLALGGLIIAPISAGVNSFFGFQRAKQKHLMAMIQKLYYLTLANNASVLTRLIDSAEDEEYKEADARLLLPLARRSAGPTPGTSPGSTTTSSSTSPRRPASRSTSRSPTPSPSSSASASPTATPAASSTPPRSTRPSRPSTAAGTTRSVTPDRRV